MKTFPKPRGKRAAEIIHMQAVVAGQIGGLSRSARKIEAARLNGKKGGRPVGSKTKNRNGKPIPPKPEPEPEISTASALYSVYCQCDSEVLLYGADVIVLRSGLRVEKRCTRCGVVVTIPPDLLTQLENPGTDNPA